MTEPRQQFKMLVVPGLPAGPKLGDLLELLQRRPELAADLFNLDPDGSKGIPPHQRLAVSLIIEERSAVMAASDAYGYVCAALHHLGLPNLVPVTAQLA